MDGERFRQGGSLHASDVDASVHRAPIHVDQDELIRLTLDLCNIESPAGREAEVGAFVFEWMRNEGFAPRKIGMFPDRFNVLGTLAGAGRRLQPHLQQPHGYGPQQGGPLEHSNARREDQSRGMARRRHALRRGRGER